MDSNADPAVVSEHPENSRSDNAERDTGRLETLLKQKHLLQNGLDRLLRYQEEVIDLLLALCELDAEKYDAELEAVQSDSRFAEVISKVTSSISKCNDNRKSVHSSSVRSSQDSNSENITQEHYDISRDMHSQLKRISVPKFSGNKLDYPLFKDAFEHCIDKVNCSDGYKMLQLRQHLTGDALKAIEGLSATTLGYTSAKNRLDEKFGGHRRTVLIHLDSIRQIRSVNFSDLKSLSEFTDKLELSIIALKDAGRVEEFEDNSMFYSVAKSKMSALSIANFKRWSSVTENTENLVNLHAWLALEVKIRTEAEEEVDGFYGTSKWSKNYDDSKRHNRTYSTSGPVIEKCTLCGNSHHISVCNDFKSLTKPRRWQLAKDKLLCFRCLSPTHKGRFCRNFKKCNIDGCPRSHHTLLHGGGYENPQMTRPVMMHSSSRGHISMRIIPVLIDSGHRTIQLNALMDECSTDSYISQSVAYELGLYGQKSHLDVSVLGGRLQSIETYNVNFSIQSTDRQTQFNISAYAVDELTDDLEIVDWSKYAHNWPHLQDIDFPKVGNRVRVDLLLGLNVPGVHRCLTEICGRSGEPIARLTPLGWTCIGQLPELKSSCQFTSSMEFDGIRYQIAIPWKQNEPSLSNNYTLALSRLNNLEKSLSSRPLVASEYVKIIKDYEQKGYIKEISNFEITGWYIPHFPVVRFDKSTTKVRVVLDAASKFNGKSLNSCIYAGPKLQRDLVAVLIRFRSKPIAIAGDISEMFLNIGLKPSDSPYHRILWRDLDPCKPVKIYEFQRLVFGNTASPFLSQLVIREHVRSNFEDYKLGANSILESMYVDDLLDSADSVEQAKTLRVQISELLSKAGFHIRKWTSNNKELLSEIPIEDRADNIEINDKNILPCLKTLGVLWKSDIDSFTFKIDSPQEDLILTKRVIVSKTAQLFDPLNLLAPFTVRAKIGIQETWIKGLSWDEPLPSDLYEKWNLWFDELSLLEKVNVSRCLVDSEKVIAQKSVHTFVDASEVAFATAVYLRTEYNDQSISVNLVAAKTRVAPLKAITIPKLELSAAVLGLRLAQSVCKVLEIQNNSVTFWTDSQNVLYWIRGQSRNYKPFVANRVGEIHTLSEPIQWRYVSTEVNSSDLATRGLSAKTLSESNLWWQGPPFLSQSKDKWPILSPLNTPESAFSEVRSKCQTSFVAKIVNNRNLGRLAPNRFSSWMKLVRVTGWIFRFINNSRTSNHDNKLFGELSVKELSISKIFWNKIAQNDCFSKEIVALKSDGVIGNRSPLLPLNPTLDDNGVLRVNGRLKYAEHLSYDTKFPIILPKDHDVSSIILSHYQYEGNHNLGVSHLLSNIREKYHIIRARQLIKSFEHNCAECKRRKGKVAKQLMAPLPSIRLGTPLRAFAKIGVDFAGPFITKQGRGRIKTKRYLCLFTCRASRAVHLEMAWGLDTPSFLLAFDRFINRRGRPILVLSDNGTNFVGANRELKNIWKLNNLQLSENLSKKGIQWRFNPPAAPHFGGVFEALIKSAKRAIHAVLGEADINDEELLTAFIHAEGLLNSRPLYYQNNDPDELPVLTPNHFLFGRLGEQLVPCHLIDNVRFNPRHRWRRIQDLANQFWKRWLREFLPTLNSRTKWQTPFKDLKVGDVVLVINPQSPRGKWPLGRIVKTYSGIDDRVRVVDVKINNQVLKRPIHQLCPLEA